jgi:Pyruvate/2-oxoacid:ferredoxin oxidoreductase delta subunit
MMTFKVSKWVEVRFQIVGFHKWPAAPEDVKFLASTHRHTFHFRVRVPVVDSDRQTEFTQLKLFCQDKVYEEYGRSPKNHTIDFCFRSCEMIAEMLAARVMDHYEVPHVLVSVGEDDEFEGIVFLQQENSNEKTQVSAT